MAAREPSFFRLELDDLLARYREAFPLPVPARAPVELARAISTSEPLRGSEAVIVVREDPPALAIVARTDPKHTALLRALPEHLDGMLARIRYIDWDEVRKGTQELARRLEQEMGADLLERASYQAIPRGGHIVLGLLALALDLRPGQLSSRGGASPLVVVDDCALSGARFAEFVAAHENREIVFATLFSPPALRAAIQQTESNVVACVSAADLTDYSENMPEPERTEWRERWRARGERYWTGQPDHVVFPWSEPETGIWDPTTESIISGWRIAPPSLCLANGGRSHAEVEQVRPGDGQLRMSESVLYISDANAVTILDLDSGQAWELQDTSATMWRALLASPSIGDVVAHLTTKYDVDEDTATNDLEMFVRDVESRGWLTRNE